MKLEKIYTLHKHTVFNLALSYVHNAQDAEEITQDVFISVHKNIKKFKHQSSLKTWIYRITINTSLDFLKAQKRNKRKALFQAKNIDSTTIQIANFDHPGVQLEDKEDLERLFTHISSLPENQRTALILLKIEQKKIAEVAEIMNLSPKALEGLFFRAKVNLKKFIEKYEGF
ncbi:MAG: RNA polymerase sigma factor [Flavobacteriales bacterium]